MTAPTEGAPSRARAVLELLAQADTWQPFVGPTGAHLWRIPGDAKDPYTVGVDSCTCPSDQYGHGVPCKHRLALVLFRQVARAYLKHARAIKETHRAV